MTPGSTDGNQLLEFGFWEPLMNDGYRKKVDLGRCGEVTLHLSKDAKHLLLEFETKPDGLDKTGLNSFIDALKKVREKMDR